MPNAFLASTSLEINHTSKDIVKKSQVGAGVAVKIEHAVYESAKLFGRHFSEQDLLVSHLSRSVCCAGTIAPRLTSFMQVIH